MKEKRRRRDIKREERRNEKQRGTIESDDEMMKY